MTLLIFIMTGISLTLLALAMNRHYTKVFNKPQSLGARRLFQWTGWPLLAGSLAVAGANADGGVRIVTWIALLAFQSFAISIVLSTLWKERH